MNDQIKKGKYQHYKGNFYEVMGTAKHSETRELMVVYKALYQTEACLPEGQRRQGENLWVRPLKMFLETVETAGKVVPRFTFINE